MVDRSTVHEPIYGMIIIHINKAQMEKQTKQMMARAGPDLAQGRSEHVMNTMATSWTLYNPPATTQRWCAYHIAFPDTIYYRGGRIGVLMNLHVPFITIILIGKNKRADLTRSVMNHCASRCNKYCVESFHFTGPSQKKVVKVNKARWLQWFV